MVLHILKIQIRYQFLLTLQHGGGGYSYCCTSSSYLLHPNLWNLYCFFHKHFLLFWFQISPNRRHHFTAGVRNREESETVEVESSGRFSPRASPNVSTSGRPSSEAGSVENTDLEVISIKTEVSDEFLPGNNKYL